MRRLLRACGHRRPRTETTVILEMVDNSLKAGGSGLSVGRNVFQHPKRVQLVRACGPVHQGLSSTRRWLWKASGIGGGQLLKGAPPASIRETPVW